MQGTSALAAGSLSLVSLPLPVSLLVGAVPQAAFAQSLWQGGSDDYDSPANWSSGIPEGAGAEARFGAAGVKTVNVLQGHILGRMTFLPGAAPYTLNIGNSSIVNVYDGISNNSGVE
ncbi:hypothetical protein QNA08_17105 [Chelatococcus sp. SYSU_G07232]|uniref:Uncharacterized protein n=1 Tax=Chelatococcus albus TaxID=3047466 RepID=A0ABT7AKP8_9HYPH|nr:hypothetical protein [Chelatococcus sp. SYSU_G07232]MDJ1159935.1 hypothetical protein [Chelatococcus sp. SYSU_G07232]